ncbi:MAG: fibronectin type III domain-containing protein, partial [Thaumarchaeota archaeon]|nr:fibronectin type III domain-containing protein [Nitrososphaerota archaeon]
MNLTRPKIIPKFLGMVTGIAIITLVGLLPAFATSGIQTVTQVPTNLIATPTSSSQISLIWNAPINATQSGITGYQIQRNGTILVNNTASLTTSFTDSGLLPNHLEQYSVASLNSNGTSAFSNIAIAATLNPIITSNQTNTTTDNNQGSTTDNNQGSTTDNNQGSTTDNNQGSTTDNNQLSSTGIHHDHKVNTLFKDHRNGKLGSTQHFKVHVKSNTNGFTKQISTHIHGNGFTKQISTHIHG